MNRRALFAACSVVMLLLGGSASAEDDRRALQGVWKGYMVGDPDGSMEITITEAEISGRNPKTGRTLGHGPYTLDSGAKTLDTSRIIGSGRGKPYLGIYSLSGGVLKWCATSRKTRPAALEHRPGRDEYLMILRKQR